MSGIDAMRLYLPEECGPDGYPPAWHESIKHLVRELAGHRCVRCLHPYRSGAGKWSPCDERCRHGGPVRVPGHGGRIGTEGIECDTINVPEYMRRGYTVEAQWRILTVHHLTGCWGREGDAKRDCRWWNLAALCQRCHLTIQRKVDMHRVYPWEHSEWFRPYVAGWYAWAYLGEDLSREQVEARMDELLALERVA